MAQNQIKKKHKIKDTRFMKLFVELLLLEIECKARAKPIGGIQRKRIEKSSAANEDKKR